MTLWLRRATVAAAAPGLLAGCTVLPIAQADAIRSGRADTLDVRALAAAVWAKRAIPALTAAAVPLSTLLADTAADPAGAGRRHGRQAGEGSPWTVVVRGEGIVRQAETAPPDRRLALSADGATLIVQGGPLVSGSAIRNALPFLRFDDVPDQIAFAELGTELTRRAVTPLRATLAGLRPGDRVRFLGVVTLGAPGEPLLMTPVSIEPSPGRAGAAA